MARKQTGNPLLKDRYILVARCLTISEKVSFRINFYKTNPHYQGAPIEDCLAPLDLDDRHLDIVETIREPLDEHASTLRKLVAPCVHACLFAHTEDSSSAEFQQHVSDLMQRCASVLECEGIEIE